MKHIYEAEGAQEDHLVDVNKMVPQHDGPNLYTLAVAVLVGVVLGMLVMLPAHAQTFNLMLCDTAEQARRFVELSAQNPHDDVNHIAQKINEEEGYPSACGFLPSVQVEVQGIVGEVKAGNDTYRILAVTVLAVGFQPVAVPTTQHVLMRVVGPPERSV